MKQKYVRLKDDHFVIFPEGIKHSKFKTFKPIAAGFCHVGQNKVICFGESTSLSLEAKEDDSYFATAQIFSMEKAEKLKSKGIKPEPVPEEKILVPEPKAKEVVEEEKETEEIKAEEEEPAKEE